MSNIDDIRLTEGDLLALLGYNQAQLELANRRIAALRQENAELRNELEGLKKTSETKE